MDRSMPVNLTELPDGGLDVTITLAPAEAEALTFEELRTIADSLHSALVGLSMLRTGTGAMAGAAPERATAPTTDDWYFVLQGVYDQLLPRLGAVGAAAVKAHAAAGGSVDHLAAAMDTDPQAAQERREAILATRADLWESWAWNGGTKAAHDRLTATDDPPEHDDAGPQD